jgi:hypothetical protein
MVALALVLSGARLRAGEHPQTAKPSNQTKPASDANKKTEKARNEPPIADTVEPGNKSKPGADRVKQNANQQNENVLNFLW